MVWFFCHSSRTNYLTQKSNNMARKYSPKASEKVEDAMHEMKRGELKSGRSGKKVTSRKQAIAIGLSEARERGAKVPKKAGSKKSASKKSSSKKTASKKSTATKKTASKKTVTRKSPTKISTARKSSGTKKAASKKSSTSKKSTARKSTAKKKTASRK